MSAEVLNAATELSRDLARYGLSVQVEDYRLGAACVPIIDISLPSGARYEIWGTRVAGAYDIHETQTGPGAPCDRVNAENVSTGMVRAIFLGLAVIEGIPATTTGEIAVGSVDHTTNPWH